MKDNVLRSPFFYVGDKYKLMPQLRELFPKDIDTYVEPFVGGGSSFLNVTAKHYVVNDIDASIIELHKWLTSYKGKDEQLLNLLYEHIDKYGLSCSYKGICVPNELKKKYVKTYYSHYNREAYQTMKNDYNKESSTDLLYLLLIYGFNHMIRFNKSGEFNVPVGNLDFNKNVFNAIQGYLSFMTQNIVEFYNMDFMAFLEQVKLNEHSYVYLDPPYLITGSEYTKYWNESEEIRLCKYLDFLNDKGIRFGITNLINHKGKLNEIFLKWSKKYYVYNINSNYISFNDNTVKKESKEVFVTNYGKKEI
jgi:DNA adenine methylase Dam